MSVEVEVAVRIARIMVFEEIWETAGCASHAKNLYESLTGEGIL